MEIPRLDCRTEIDVDLEMDGKTLKEVRDVVEKLIEEYGPDVQMIQDAGYNNITTSVVLTVPESDEAYATRVKKIMETEERIRKRELKMLRELIAKYPGASGESK